MKRRTFIQGVGGMSMMAPGAYAEGSGKTRYYLLDTYYLRNSTQLPRLHEYMSRGFLPAASKLHDGPKIFLEGLVAAHLPQYATVLGFGSLEEMASLREHLHQDEGFRKAFAAWEDGPEPPYEYSSRALLKAAEYSPEVGAAPAKGKPRIFELRVYHSPTWKQLAALHQRFAGPEVRIFHRVGVHPILYTETAIGPNMPNLTYLIPFDSLAAREKAWDTFGADPEWIRVRKESIEQHGQISSVIQMTLFRAAPYSPVA